MLDNWFSVEFINRPKLKYSYYKCLRFSIDFVELKNDMFGKAHILWLLSGSANRPALMWILKQPSRLHMLSATKVTDGPIDDYFFFEQGGGVKKTPDFSI
jgi:hypothetical protein